MNRWDTFVLIGSGPSLTVEDVEFVRGKARVIAINNAVELASDAFALYAADRKWIDRFDGVPSFKGLKYSIESHDTTTRHDWHVMRNTGFLGLETEANGLRTGFNSGFQSLNLAYHMGARRCLLLGYDMQVAADGRDHFFGSHPDGAVSPYQQMIEAFASIVQPLKDAGVSVVNCTPGSALKCFPMARLQDVLALERAA